MTDARQRAREVAGVPLCDRYHPSDVLDAIEAYFDERMRGEARDPGDGPGAWARGRDAGHASAAGHVDKLRARVAELEAVVRAADAMRERMTCAVTYSKGWAQDRCDCSACEMMRAWDAARAKVTVPGE